MDKEIKKILNDAWKLFEHTGYRTMESDLQWEIFLNYANDIRKRYGAENTPSCHYCRNVLMAMQDYYVNKAVAIPKEEAAKIRVSDRKAIYNLLQDAAAMARDGDCSQFEEKYDECSPAVKTLFQDLTNAGKQHAEVKSFAQT